MSLLNLSLGPNVNRSSTTTICSMLIDDDIDEIIRRGEEKTKEINSKYAGLDLDALNNFKSESLVNTWEGEDYGNRVSLNVSIDMMNDVANTNLATKTSPSLD